MDGVARQEVRVGLIVIVADNAEIDAKNKKIVRWDISDVSQDDYNEIRRTIDIIEKKVKELVNKLSE